MNGTELNMEKPEITLNGLADLTEGSFLLIDTRDEASYEYGTMENAIHFPNLYEEARAGRLPADKKLVLFCMHGIESLALAVQLREMGYDAVSLKDGYGAWLRAFSLKKEDKSREIELSIIKKRNFHEKIFSKFTKAITHFNMIEPSYKIAVFRAGGKA